MKWRFIIPLWILLILPGTLYLEFTKYRHRQRLSAVKTACHEEPADWAGYLDKESRKLPPPARRRFLTSFTGVSSGGEFRQQVMDHRRRFYRGEYCIQYPVLLFQTIGLFVSENCLHPPDGIYLNLVVLNRRDLHLEIGIEGFSRAGAEGRESIENYAQRIRNHPGIMETRLQYQDPDPPLDSEGPVFSLGITLEVR